MRKLELRGGKILEGDLCAPKGFRLYCNEVSGLLQCETFATVAYLSAGNYLRGYSSRVAKVGGGKQTARAVLLSNCAGDVLQRHSRDRAIERVNFSSDKLGVPASELRPMFIGTPTHHPDDALSLEGIAECAKSLRSSKQSDLSLLSTQTYLSTVQFFLGDDYVCTISGALFTEKNAPFTKRSILLTTDVAIDSEYLHKALASEIRETFGLWHVPPSPNDGYMILSSGLAGNYKISRRDSEFLKFTKALSFVISQLCIEALSIGGEKELIELKVVGATSKHLAMDVVNNAYVYFSLEETRNCSLLQGLFSCIGAVDSPIRRSRLRVWLQADEQRILLTDRGRILYVNTESTEQLLSAKEVKLTIDFQDGNFSAAGWIQKRDVKVFDL